MLLSVAICQFVNFVLSVPEFCTGSEYPAIPIVIYVDDELLFQRNAHGDQ